MAEYNLGRVGIVPMGEYNTSTTYNRLDLVTHDGNSYMAVKSGQNIPVTNTAYWQKVAMMGKSYNPKGEWISKASYKNDLAQIDVISYNGVSYYCKVTHTGSTNTPDIDTTNWGVLVVLGSAASIQVTDTGEYYDSTDVEGVLQEVGSELATHKADTMPHKFEDLKNTVTYKFGFQLSAEGNPQIIYEEVV